MSLKEILESHPVRNLKAIIREVKSDIGPKLMFSKDKKSHKKEKLISHIIELNKLGLIEKLPDMYVKPKAKPRKKRPATPQLGDDSETHTMPNGKTMTGKTHSKDSKPVKKKKTLVIEGKEFKKRQAKKKKLVIEEDKKTKTVEFVAKNPPPAKDVKFEVKNKKKKVIRSKSNWASYLEKYRESYPNIKGKQVMIEAGKAWRKTLGLKPK